MSNSGHAVRKNSLKTHQHLHHPYGGSQHQHSHAVDARETRHEERQERQRSNSGHAHLLRERQATPTFIKPQSAHPPLASSNYSGNQLQARMALTTYTPIPPMYNASGFSSSIHNHIHATAQKYPAWPQANPASVFDLEEDGDGKLDKDQQEDEDEDVSPTAAPPSPHHDSKFRLPTSSSSLMPPSLVHAQPIHTYAHAQSSHHSHHQPQKFSTSPLLSDLGMGFNRMAVGSSERSVGKGPLGIEGFEYDSYHHHEEDDAVLRPTSFVLDEELMQASSATAAQDDRVKWWLVSEWNAFDPLYLWLTSRPP